MVEKTNEELIVENLMLKRDIDRLKLINEAIKSEKKRADESYAPIIVKTIVYTAIGVFCLGIITAFANYLSKIIFSN